MSCERQMEMNEAFTVNLQTKIQGFQKRGCSIPSLQSLQYLVRGVEAMSRAVRLGHVQNTHLSPTRLQ